MTATETKRADMSDDDEVDEKNRRSPSPDIKSTAIVKYTSVKCPVGFSKLQCNTDLKLPPSNWLSSATDSYGLRHALLNQSFGFSSFRMAHMFPDCVGEVDVVSGAECIKNLLKLPYHQNGVVSMIVHRVENTLLLDNFDVFQYLKKSEWSWMKKFFYENFLKSISAEDRLRYIKNKSRLALQQKSLVSKFLYHSLPPSKSNDIRDEDSIKCQPSTLPITGPTLPDPDDQKNIPSFSNHTYNRNVVWTFEDIQMLIGSDMPIFGGIDRPCVSLRLQNASEPINVLTGIDYWLDNLMCNVPEVIMCYHLDGIVRRYEPIKTEDLPNMKDSKFSPKVIRNVAQNILSFLKSNATKAGHTYWLFKGTNDDVVKLYDLSTLCGTFGNSTDQNPFTVPVAMLLYRVAKNMKLPCQSAHIKMLLENCIKLLPVDQHPHIIASSHFMLANLYIPMDTNPTLPKFNKTSTSTECECGDPETCRRQEFDDEIAPPRMQFDKEDDSSDMLEETMNAGSSDASKFNEQMTSSDVTIRTLLASNNHFSTTSTPLPAITKKIEDRCLLALKHVYNGLSALKFYASFNASNKKNTEQVLREEENPKMAKSFEPIPMGYGSVKNEEQNKPESPVQVEKDTAVESMKSDKTSRRRKRDSKNKKKLNENQNKLEDLESVRQKLDGIVLRKDGSLPTLQDATGSEDVSWKIHLKILLYEKASLLCATLAEQYFTEGKYGQSYKYVNISQKCKIIFNTMLNNNNFDDCNLLRRAGDNLYQFAKNWVKFESDYFKTLNSLSDIEKDFMSELIKDLENCSRIDNSNLLSLDFKHPINMENSMIMSGECYSKAFKIAHKDRKEELLRRMASVKNELGLIYMYKAQEEIYGNKEIKEVKNNKELSVSFSKKSYSLLFESMKIFEQVNDIPNTALLHCNMGRYLRFRAHCNQANNSPDQRKFYSEAIEHYGQALQLLVEENCDNLKDSVRWELSSTLFNRACLLQDSPQDVPDAASEAAEALRLALRNCPLLDGPRQCLYQFRAGLLHHRLASLYHNQFRDPSTEPAKAKAAFALSKINYENAYLLFLPLEDTTMILTVQLKHVALLEFQANNAPGLKMKFLQYALQLLQQCEPALKLIRERDAPVKKIDDIDSSNCSLNGSGSTAEDDIEAEMKLLTLFEQRLQFILKSLTQVCMQKPSAWKKENESLMLFYKNAYSLTLKINKDNKTDCKDFAKSMCDMLLQIKRLQNNSDS